MAASQSLSPAYPPKGTGASRPRRGKSDSLMPREHGIYAEVTFPMLTVFLLGAGSWAGTCLAVAVVAAFLLHEPIMVLGGRRGSRVQRELGPKARKHGRILGGVLLFAGLLGLGLTFAMPQGESVLLALVGLVPMAALLAPLVWHGRDKTPLGEALVALMLAYVAVPIGLAGGLDWQQALVVAAVWALTFLLATASVHVVLMRAKKRPMARLTANTMGLTCVALIAAASWAALDSSPSWWPLATLPVAIACLAITLLGVTPKHLKRIGWTMVATNVLTLVALLLTV